MTEQDFKTYLHNYNAAVERYATANDITPEEVVDMISVGELVIK